MPARAFTIYVTSDHPDTTSVLRYAAIKIAEHLAESSYGIVISHNGEIIEEWGE